MDKLEHFLTKIQIGIPANFTKRENLVLLQRFFEGKTLEQVGNLMGVTRERVRQIEEKACEKIATTQIYALYSQEII